MLSQNPMSSISMTDEELWHATTLRRYRFDSIPKKAFDKYRAECAEMAAWLMQEAAAFKNLAQSTDTPPDINAQPESFEYSETLAEFIDQGVLGLECADGLPVVFEVTRSQFEKLDPDYFHIQRSVVWPATSTDWKLGDNATFYVMTPSGALILKLIDDEPSPESD